VPAEARRVLDVGCRSGRTGEALRARGHEVVGIESDLGLAELAQSRLDRVIVAELDGFPGLPEDAGAFDAILLDATLARVREPEELLRALLPALAPDGVLVMAVPNVKHWSVLAAVYAEDRWEYTDDDGLLDRRNFHFLTLEEVSRLLDDAGLEATGLTTRQDPLPGRLGVLVDIAADYGGEREETALRLSATHYLVTAKPS
jgi:SAM-dependent methyltransferase